MPRDVPETSAGFAPRPWFYPIAINPKKRIMNTHAVSRRIIRRAFRFLAPLTLACATAGSLHATVLLDSDSMSSDRTTQNLPAQVAWYSSGSTGSVTHADGSYTVLGGNSLLGYFTALNAPVTLNVGETLKVEIGFRLTDIVASNDSPVRIGLFNSGGVRVTGDGSSGSGSSTPYRDYTGYAGLLRQDQTSAIMIRERDADKHDSLIATAGGGSAYSGNLVSGGSRGSLSASTPYIATLEVTRESEGSVRFGISVSGGGLTSYSASVVDSTDPYYTFDTLVFYTAGGGVISSYVLDSVNISLIPEPGTAGLAFGIGAFAFIGAMRRRRTSVR